MLRGLCCQVVSVLGTQIDLYAAVSTVMLEASTSKVSW